MDTLPPDILSIIDNMVPRDADQSSPTAKLIKEMIERAEREMIKIVVDEAKKLISLKFSSFKRR